LKVINKNKIMIKKILFLFFGLFVLSPTIVFAQEKKPVTYFYADWCSHCQKVNKFFNENGIYDKYDFQKFNFDEPANKIKLTNMLAEKKYGGQAGIPAIFIDDIVLTGDTDIIAYFEKKLPPKEVEIKQSPVKTGVDLPIWLLLGAAFADAANPCALAVLILLLATVISAKGKNHALLSGLMFSLAIFLSYLLMGLSVYRAIGAFGVARYLSLGVGVLAILIALANFKDVFWYGKFFIMEVPLSWRPKMQEIIRRATSPWSAFGIGFLVSLFLVPCASGPYVVILGKLAEKTDMAKTFSLLMLYNLVFVSPMIMITLGMYFFNAKLSKLEKMRRENLRVLHAITGAIMLAVGLYLIYTKI
jgi:cytochrome c biogenesis protein CcdA